VHFFVLLIADNSMLRHPDMPRLNAPMQKINMILDSQQNNYNPVDGGSFTRIWHWLYACFI